MAIAEKVLKNLRTRLLATTRRNRLLNFNPNLKDCLRIVDELPNQVCEVLLEGKTMSFIPVNDPTKEELVEKGYISIDPETKEETELKPYPKARQWAEEIGITTDFELPYSDSKSEPLERHLDLDIQTLFYTEKLNKRLKSIYRKSKSLLNETGANILFLSFGFLDWHDSGYDAKKKQKKAEAKAKEAEEKAEEAKEKAEEAEEKAEEALKQKDLSEAKAKEAEEKAEEAEVKAKEAEEKAEEAERLKKLAKVKHSIAPLFLIPVFIEKGKFSVKKKVYEYTVKYSGENIVKNLSLEEKLKTDFGLQLPELEDEDKPEDYLKKVDEAIISKQRDWKIRRYGALSLLNFSQLLMYLDLDPRNWPAKGLTGHPLISKFLGEISSDDTEVDDSYLYNDIQPPYEFDSFDDMHTKYPIILDADSSQHSAIIDSVDGKDIVIEGPPGTGKSQTIVNLIGAAINEGKSVLFVAEKQAALKVVFDRLRNKKLGDFCLNLHSHHSVKVNVFADIKSRIEKKFPENDEISKQIQLYDGYIKKLNGYADKINSEWKSTDYTIHQIFTRASRFRDLLNTEDLLDSIERKPDGINRAEIENCEGLLNLYKQYYEEVLKQSNDTSSIAESAWYGFNNLDLQSFEHVPLENSLNDWQDALKDWVSFETNVVQNYDFVQKQTDFVKKPEIIEELEKLDALNLDEINFQDLRKINAKNLSFNIDNFEAFKDLQLRQTELVGILGAQNFLSTYESEALEDVSSDLFTSIDNRLTFDQISSGLEDLSNLNSNLNEIDELLQKVNNNIAGSKDNQLTLSIDGISEFIDVIEAVRLIKPEYVEKRDLSLDNTEVSTLLEDLKPQLFDIMRRHEVLSEFFNIDSLPEWTLLSSIQEILSKKSLFKILNPDYRKAKKEILNFAKNPYIKYQKLLLKLSEVITYKKNISDINDNEKYRKAFGSHLKGIETDIEVIEANIDWFKGLHNLFGSQFETRNALKQISDDSLHLLQELLRNGIKSKLEKLASELNKIGYIFPTLLTDANASLSGEDGTVSKIVETVQSDMQEINQFSYLIQPDSCVDEIFKIINKIQKFKDDYESWEKSSENNAFFYSPSILINNSDPLSSNNEIQKTINLAEIIYSELKNEQLKNFLSVNSNREVFENLIELKDETLNKYTSCSNLFDSFNELAKLDIKKWLSNGDNSHDTIIARNEKALNSFDSLPAWIDYILQLSHLEEPGLTNFAAQVDASNDYEHIVDIYRSIIFNQMGQDIIKSERELSRFSSFTHQKLQKQFIECDEKLMELQIESISNNADQKNRPNIVPGNGSGLVSTYTEWSLLKHEIRKKTRHTSLRQLVNKAGQSLKAIKPCFMMSPMSVAQYLAPGEIEFDLVVMDEASQIKPEYALGAIARGKQLIVVGDPKQLPPTNFFQKNVIDDDDHEQTEIQVSESILDVAMKDMPLRRLTWHYRSRHQSLIAFSNYQFYDDTLKVFTSPEGASPELGLNYSRLNDSIYSNRMNTDEAKVIAKAVKSHLLSKPRESLGVVAFNIPQEKEIREQIEILAREDRVFSRAYDKYRSQNEEPFFVKNIESVQGDERDVIYISMTYGPNENGKFYKRFNTGKDSFWRRLNVLFTRAKKKMHVFSSYGSADIDNAEDRGMIALNGFLKYCETGKINKTIISGKDPDNDFEVSVIDMLSSYTFQCIPQVGEAGFFIDIGVRDPNKPGTFLMAIECDGATYHSSTSARDRDRLRQQILEGYGWKVRRIWSTDWFNNPNKTIQPIIKELKKLSSILPVEEKYKEDDIGQIIKEAENVKRPEFEYMNLNENLYEKLSRFNKEVVEKNFPNTDPEKKLLRPSLVEALINYKPSSKTEFTETMPVYLTSNIDSDEASEYLDSVINLIKASNAEVILEE